MYSNITTVKMPSAIASGSCVYARLIMNSKNAHRMLGIGKPMKVE